MNYIQVDIESSDQQQKEILIALLSEHAYEGFEEQENSLKAFVPADRFHEDVLQQLLKENSYKTSTIVEKNWNKEWESNFQPVVIDDFCAIRAEFHMPITKVQYEILITPKMSFGTGHHATTEMMIRMMKEIEFTGKTVFDFGTGTGVLAILAEKLGAEKIVAIDNDEWSYVNAAENFKKNFCSKIKLVKTSTVPIGKFHIILANITRYVIVNNFQQLLNCLTNDGSLVISGILEADEEEITRLAKLSNLDAHSKRKIGDWICLKFDMNQILRKD